MNDALPAWDEVGGDHGGHAEVRQAPNAGGDRWVYRVEEDALREQLPTGGQLREHGGQACQGGV
jgi:hypothetical protein